LSTGPGQASQPCSHICSPVFIPHYVSGELTGRAAVLGMDTRESSLAKLVREMAVVTQDPENRSSICSSRTRWCGGWRDRGWDSGEHRQRLDHALRFLQPSRT